MKNIDSIVKAADAYIERGNYECAIAQYDVLVSRFKDNPRYYALRGYCYAKIQQFANALRDYSIALSLKSDAPSTLYNRAKIYFDMGEFDLALEDYKKSASLSPKWDVFFNIGLIYRYRHEFEQARQAWRHALLFDCDNNLVNRSLTSLMRVVKKNSVLRTVSLVLFNDSSKIRKYVQNAQQYIRCGACEDALNVYQNLLIHYPRDVRIYLLRGCCYYYMECYENALHDFVMAATIAPKNSSAWINQARVYMKIANGSMAIQTLKRSFELEDAWDIWYLLGILREDNNEFNQARLCYLKALQRAPERKFIKVILRKLMRRIRLTSGLRIGKMMKIGEAASIVRNAASLVMSGNCEAALDSYNTLVDHFPQCRLRYEMRGCCFYFMEEYEKACRDFSAQLELTPRQASVWFNRAQAYAALERFSEALSDLAISEKLLPRNDISFMRDSINKYLLQKNINGN